MGMTDLTKSEGGVVAPDNGSTPPPNGLAEPPEGPDGARPFVPTEVDIAVDGVASADGTNGPQADYARQPAQSPKPKAQSPIESLLKLVRSYNPDADFEAIRKAYTFAEEAHEGQKRGTGEPYITHPLQVAVILAEMRLDVETLQSALLHDVIEDTPVTFDDISKRFGPVVAHLVEGVTKLGAMPKLRSLGEGEKGDKKQRETHQQAENLRKMFLAMFDDPRVVLIKLADRLHNMRTLKGLPPDKQKRIAEQTLEIYAPLANRLGIWQIKGELEDLAFSYIAPERYRELATMLRATKMARDRYLQRVITTLEKELDKSGIKVEIKGRVKHIYSLYQKMERKRQPFEHIYDVLAVRVVVDTKESCYAALGIIHSLWPPIPREFDDYISRPKESMYQSLHTAVRALDNKSLEIQIRTHEMHELAEYGIAAHWRYKEGKGGRRDPQYEQKIAWLRRLMSWRDEVENATDFVDSLKSDVFQEHIYVFTPQGDIVELPRGATPLDFAYRIHTNLGHQCAGARVNNRIITLDTPLENGAVVSIIKSKNRVGPSRDWLQSDRFLKTGNARSKIRQYFRRQRRDENIAQGRSLLDGVLKHLGLTHVSQADVLTYFPRYAALEDFLEAIGNTDISPQSITTKLGEHRPYDLFLPQADVPTAPLPVGAGVAATQIVDTGGVLMQLGRCCKPMPGDEIIGYTTVGRGITVHNVSCPNVTAVRDPGRLLHVSWPGKKQEKYPAGVRVEALDRVGLLRDITVMLADEHVNLVSIHTQKKPGSATTTLLMTLEVAGVEQLSRVMDRLKSISGMYEVHRDTGVSPQASTT